MKDTSFSNSQVKLSVKKLVLEEEKKIRRIVWKDAIFHLVFSFFNAPKSHLGRHRGKIVHSTQSCQPKLVIKIKNPLATADFNSLCFLIIELFFPHFSWCNQTFKKNIEEICFYYPTFWAFQFSEDESNTYEICDGI